MGAGVWRIALLTAMLSAPIVAHAAISDIRLEDKIESMKKAGVGPVIYPHARHEKLYKCNACHPKIFKEKREENDISMKKNMEGKYCGSPNCHNSPKAFPLYNCERCHTNVKGVKPKR